MYRVGYASTVDDHHLGRKPQCDGCQRIWKHYRGDTHRSGESPDIIGDDRIAAHNQDIDPMLWIVYNHHPLFRVQCSRFPQGTETPERQPVDSRSTLHTSQARAEKACEHTSLHVGLRYGATLKKGGPPPGGLAGALSKPRGGSRPVWLPEGNEVDHATDLLCASTRGHPFVFELSKYWPRLHTALTY